MDHINSHKPKKHLGQNFLQSREALNQILEAADIQPDENILEIGPGLGVLTKELAKKTKNLTTIELDTDLIPHLQKTLPAHVQIIHQDALTYEPSYGMALLKKDEMQGKESRPQEAYETIRREGSDELDDADRLFQKSQEYKVVANIPYYITSPLINHFLQRENPPTSLTLLVQKEVAEKICKIDPDMSVLSLQVALFGTAKIIAKVPNTAFHPIPKVDSAIIHIQVQNKYPLEKALAILTLAKKAFTSKRKKLSNTLKSHAEILATLNLGDKRPEHLSIEDWENLLSA